MGDVGCGGGVVSGHSILDWGLHVLMFACRRCEGWDGEVFVAVVMLRGDGGACR